MGAQRYVYLERLLLHSTHGPGFLGVRGFTCQVFLTGTGLRAGHRTCVGTEFTSVGVFQSQLPFNWQIPVRGPVLRDRTKFGTDSYIGLGCNTPLVIQLAGTTCHLVGRYRSAGRFAHRTKFGTDSYIGKMGYQDMLALKADIAANVHKG